MALGIISLIPTAAVRAAANTDIDDLAMVSDDKLKESPVSDDSRSDKNLEMSRLTAFRQPQPAATPYTPRTMAFNTLDRKGPSFA